MTFAGMADHGLDYVPCRYGTSRLLFRGPRRRLDGDYCVALGGSETYGRFVERPFPDLLEDRIGVPVINFGAVNAGVQGFSADDSVMAACRGARAVILQVMGAHHVSNHLYKVHPRRNDRFLRASQQLTALYPEVDFTEFHFTRHLLQTLADVDDRRFEEVRIELCRAWLARMRTLIRRIGRPVVLLWLAERRPEDETDLAKASDPLFVSRPMLDAIGPDIAALVDIAPSETARGEGRRGMVFSELEAPAALELPNPAVHAEIAGTLAEVLRDLL